MPDPSLLKPDSIRLAPLAAPLAVTQITGWGTTYWIPAMLAGPLERDIGLTAEAVFGGVTVMLLVSAVVAPRFGRLIDAHGSRWPMVAGSLVLALALLVISQATGTVSYLAGWVLIGIGMPLALTQAAAAAMAQIAGPKARQAIGLLMMIGGLSSSVFWPLSAFLEANVGWRQMCMLFALAHVVICAPIHLLALGRMQAQRPRDAGPGARTPAPPRLSPEERRAAFILMATAFSLTGFISWGLPLQLVEILKAYGHPVAFAVFVGTLMGPAQVAARFAEMTFGGRVGILTVGVISAALMPLAVLLPILGPPSPAIAIGFAIGYGMSAGAITIVRNVAPLALFGKETYATMTGWLSLPQNIVFALSPMIFAATMRHSGPTATLILAFGAALAALAVMMILDRRFRDRAAA
ncbi:MFS transporter [Phreatobacter sp.]|uniref:MFS transporter n=1 Tax=Phreatobacter sp. TaxID=1966341 RepID=UPI0025E2A81F|nr:MFS transporter [Phreatobacter sp.]